jgi:shikimate kinase
MHITLIGFMGTGKTVVGKLLAKRLKRRFIDVDQLIEQREGRAIADIFKASGERHFRKIERQTIAEVIQLPNVIIATGGGAVLDAANMRALKRCGPVICLSASVAAIAQRIQHTHHRPLVEGTDRRQRVAQLLRARRPLYAQADCTIDTSKQSAMDVTQQIVMYATKEWHSTHVCDLPTMLCKHTKDLSQRYPGRYVAIVDDRVVAVGHSRRVVYAQAAQHVSPSKGIGVVYIPPRAELVNVTP